MIGHYLLTLTAEQEDRVLTRPFGGMFEKDLGTCRCLVWTALGHAPSWDGDDMEGAKPYGRNVCSGPAYHFEDLVTRFGDRRIQAAIRNRILSNRARRTLQHRPAHAEMSR